MLNQFLFFFNITLVNLALILLKSLSMHSTHSSKQQTQGREIIQKPKRISKIFISILPIFHSILFSQFFHGILQIFTVSVFSDFLQYTLDFHSIFFLRFSYSILQIFTVYVFSDFLQYTSDFYSILFLRFSYGILQIFTVYSFLDFLQYTSVFSQYTLSQNHTGLSLLLGTQIKHRFISYLNVSNITQKL